jgi:methionine-rich copper-binding protein CopC
MDPRDRGRLAASLLVGAILAVGIPVVASAHSELKTASPADGSTATGTPDEIVLTFTEPLNPTKSSIILRDSGGTQVGRAGVDPADDNVMRLTPPSLDPGAYEIDWTSVALDGDVLRGKVAFSVVAPTPSPTIEPTATTSSVPSIAATASPAASASPPASATPASPAPSAGSPTTSGSTADVLLPVIVAIVLVVVLGGILLRGRSGSGTR